MYPAYLGAKEEYISFRSRGTDIMDATCASSMYVTQVKSSYYVLLQENVEKRSTNIDVWFDAPATGPIQNPTTEEVPGMVVCKEGQGLNVRSKGGSVRVASSTKGPGY